LRSLQTDIANGSHHQSCSLASIQHALGLGGSSLFNTVISFQRKAIGEIIYERGITIAPVDEYDPSEVRFCLYLKNSNSMIMLIPAHFKVRRDGSH
jgi:hypothetical protein